MFKILHNDSGSKARTGILKTARGDIKTPVFMPVGTQATVKTISNEELLTAGSQIILSNTYHLFLRPGESIMKEAGGLHKFMSWPKPMLTDSGGFQIFSLPGYRKVKADGVEFKSHLDGMMHFLRPEDIVRIQSVLGSDIMMVLDECLPYPSEEEAVKRSLPITHDWAARCLKEWKRRGRQDEYGVANQLFAIVQGGAYKEQRLASARHLVGLDFPGYAIGGLSVGEPSQVMYDVLSYTVPELPLNKPRYLMGVGLVPDLFEAVSLGVDMFDCVVPTRNGRNATVFSRTGKMLLRGATHARIFDSPIDDKCPCYTCRTHSRAYLRHLFNADEYLAGRLASLHNLTFFIQLLDSMRQAIEQDRFTEFRREFMANYNEEKGS